MIDTGSSDLWVNTPNSTYCEENQKDCDYYGTYDSSDSSTYSYVNSDFNISYADGSGAAGVYATETLHIGGTTLKEFQFGIGDSSSSAGKSIENSPSNLPIRSMGPRVEKELMKSVIEGVLGIGYITNEAAVGTAGAAYANLPKAMVNKGLIKSNAYSLWLNDLDSSEGSILFGGVDTNKYHGTLETLPVIPTGSAYTAFYIGLTAVSLTNSSGTTNYSSSALPTAALLDSGSSLSYLPNAIVQKIFDDLDVTYVESEGIGYVPCSMAKKDYNISYTFSSPTINVAIAELVLDVSEGATIDGEAACAFGIAPADGTTPVLGDTFLRSAYVVYDLANNEISLANTNFDSTTTSIEEIGTGADSVPDSTSVSNAATPAPSGGSSAHIGITSGDVTSNPAAPRRTQMPKHMAWGIAGAALLVL